MSFRSALVPVAFGFASSLATMAFAQEAAAPVESQTQLVATHGDWQILCAPISPDLDIQGCEMYQLLADEGGNPIAEINIAALPFGSEFPAGATVTAPLETFLPTGLGFYIGEAEEMRIEPFRVCTVIGCIVRMGLSAEEVDAMKAGSEATLVIAPFVAVDQPINIAMSLSGFTAAYDDLQTRMAEAAAALRQAGQ